MLQRTDLITGNSVPYSLGVVCGFFYVPQIYDPSHSSPMLNQLGEPVNSSIYVRSTEAIIDGYRNACVWHIKRIESGQIANAKLHC